MQVQGSEISWNPLILKEMGKMSRDELFNERCGCGQSESLEQIKNLLREIVTSRGFMPHTLQIAEKLINEYETKYPEGE